MEKSKIKEGFLGQKMIVLPDSIRKELHTICESFYITDIGFYPNAQHHYRSRKKGIKEYIFIYCIEGKGNLKVDGQLIHVLPNTYHIIHRNTPHEYNSDKNDPWSIYWMHFGGNLTDNLYKRYMEHRSNNGSIAFERSKINLFNEIFHMYKTEYTVPKLEYSNILGLNFISSFVYTSKGIATESTSHTNMINSVIDFLMSNLDKTFKSSEIAKQFNCSPSYLFNLFKKRTGYSLIHFFNLKKIQKACEYLKYTDLSIKEISYKVGIQDPLYFSRTFKKNFGVSPKEYRKTQQEF
ncbi:AraC family transcriptional regulator [Zobellia russellii]|uniref:AraC family transcriptional regulator n=1 Tax=Zobellia russellii TaxID=248907 RepID=UPI0037DDDA72